MAMLNSQRVYSWENHEFWVPYFQTTPFPCTGMLTASAHLNKWAESNYSTQLGHVDSYHITSYLTSVQELSAIVETLIYIDHIYIYISGYVKPLAIQVAGSSCFIPESHGSVWPMKHCITQWTWTFVSLATIKNEHCHCVLTFRWIVAHVWPFIFPLQGCSSRFLNWICPQSP